MPLARKRDDTSLKHLWAESVRAASLRRQYVWLRMCVGVWVPWEFLRQWPRWGKSGRAVSKGKACEG